MKRYIIGALIAGWVCLATTPVVAGSLRYTVTDLGVFGVEETPMAINNAGQIVGIDGIRDYAFLIENGIRKPLATPGLSKSRAYDINDSGVIVGKLGHKACLWQGDSVVYIPLPISAGSTATAINDAGQVVGSYSVDGSTSHTRAFVFADGVVLDLPTLGGVYNEANDINDRGQIVGHSSTSDGGLHAFLCDEGHMTDLGTFGRRTSGAKAISDSGEMVIGGWADSQNMYSCLLSGGSITDLVTPGGYPLYTVSMNDRGQIAGTGGYGSDARAYVWRDGTLINLNECIADSLWLLKTATAINDRGQIVGTGRYMGTTHGYLLTPVPEPASVLAIGCGLAALALRRRSWR